MSKKLSELSIFFPFWNEEKNIEEVVLSAREIAKSVATKWEIIMIDDGSSDDTLKKAQSIMKLDENFTVD